jgi:enamine deaminase RidA (YjgF/YER057c/UK114 family)
MNPEQNLESLGLALPPAPQPRGAYVPWKLHRGVLYISGMLPVRGADLLYTGVVGRDLDTDQGVAAARLCALNALAVAREALGKLSLISSVLRLNGVIASAPDFTGQPAVLNGASDLMNDILGENGRHTRVAAAAPVLPLNAPVMVDMILAVD